MIKNVRWVKETLDGCLFILEDFLYCYKTSKTCQKAIDRYPYGPKYFPYQQKTQEILWEPFML